MLNRLERLLDLGRELGDSPGEVTGEERMGDRGRPLPGMMLSSRGLLAPEPGGPDTAVGVAEAARPAMEDTVDTMEGGGDGVMDREAGGTVPDLMAPPRHRPTRMTAHQITSRLILFSSCDLL